MVETLDPAALDRFRAELLANGFEPTDPDRWVGPTPPSLAGLTAAPSMTIRLYDGWPYRPPAVFVKGLPIGRHRNAAGHVCLWETGDPSLEWLTLPGIRARIERWVAGAQGDARADDPGLDPHLLFLGDQAGLATIDLTNLPVAGREMRDLAATERDGVLEIGEGDLRGRWYVVDPAPQLPQRLADLWPYLGVEQREDLDQVTQSAGVTNPVVFTVFAWQTAVGPNLLILQLSRDEDGDLVIRPREAARTDQEVLLLRAGPDAPLLQGKKVAVFGVGAVGSHVANLLARCGVGDLWLFDPEALRPGDVVRHAALRFSVGKAKVEAVRTINLIAAPWTKTRHFASSHWKPTELANLAEVVDLVIDATGLANFTALLGEVCRRQARPFVSVALYRRGFVGRVRYQVASPSVAILDRPDDPRFPVIPPGPDEEGASWEAGCMASVAQASPVSVVAIAATAARVSIDSLMGRAVEDHDVLEVFQRFGPAPFDAVGTKVI